MPQNIDFEEYVSVAASESRWVVKKFILRESQRVILISSRFSANFSVNQFKLFSLFLQVVLITLISIVTQSFYGLYLTVTCRIKKKLTTVLSSNSFINNKFRDVCRINQRLGIDLFVQEIYFFISC